MIHDYFAYDRALNLGLVKMGTGTYGRPQVSYWDLKTKVTFGKYCSIARGVHIILGGEHASHYTSTYPFTEFLPGRIDRLQEKNRDLLSEEDVPEHPLTKGDVIIGNDVWIGQNALILSGVTIGNGAIIGAGSVVGSDIPAYAIAVGNPAKIIRFRFSDNDIAILNQIQWWNWPQSEIWKNYKVLMSSPSKLFATIESRPIEDQ
jgi:acetyltransferase-like isoleucine patch superfamily enzyme